MREHAIQMTLALALLLATASACGAAAAAETRRAPDTASGDHPVQSDGDHPVQSDGDHSVQSDGDHSVQSDGDHSVQSDGDHIVDDGIIDCSRVDMSGCGDPKPPRRRPRTRKRTNPDSEPDVAVPGKILDRVFFGKNEAALSSGAEVLDAFAGLALDNTDVTLIVVGRADSAEHDPDELSARRTEAVRDYLLARGVRFERIDVRIMGSRQPRIASATGSPAANRCVELAAE